MFGEWPLSERLAKARMHGFRAVEGPLPDDPAGLRSQLDVLGMAFECLSFARGDVASGELGIACLPGRRHEFREELARAIEAGQKLGCRRLHPLAGRVSNEAWRAACEATYLDNLSLACRWAAAAGMRIVIEPIGRHRQPSYLLHTCSQALGYIERLGAGQLGVILDIHHAMGSGEPPEAIAAAHASVIDVLQLAGWPQRSAPSLQDAVLQRTWHALERVNWTGCVSAEYEPQGRTEESLEWIQLIKS